MNSKSSLDWIKSGYETFRADYYPKEMHKFADLAKHGQHPEALIIACSDSRANPTAIFKARPGEVFVVRNVANIVPPFEPDKKKHGTGAAIEYAVKVLKVRMIIVMGHTGCGGVAAHIDGTDAVENDKFVGPWIEVLDKVKIQDDGRETCPYAALEQANIRNSLINLKGYDFVDTAIKTRGLDLIGAYFDIGTGILKVANRQGKFHPV